MYAFGRKTRKRTADAKWSRPNVWLTVVLKHRVQILEPIQTEEDSGGLTQKYNLMKTVWAGVRAVSHYKYREFMATEALASSSHEFIFRLSSMDGLNLEYSTAFTSSFNQTSKQHPFREDMFLMLEQGSTVKGRMFRVRRVQDADEEGEFISVLASEIEELGTGGNYGSDYIS